MRLAQRGLGIFALETGHVEGNQNAVEDFTHSKRMTAAAGLGAKAVRSHLETPDSIAYTIKPRGNPIQFQFPLFPLFW